MMLTGPKSTVNCQLSTIVSGKGVYLTVYPSSCPNTNTVNHYKRWNIEIIFFNITFKRGVYLTVHSLESKWTNCQ